MNVEKRESKVCCNVIMCYGKEERESSKQEWLILGRRVSSDSFPLSSDLCVGSHWVYKNVRRVIVECCWRVVPPRELEIRPRERNLRKDKFPIRSLYLLWAQELNSPRKQSCRQTLLAKPESWLFSLLLLLRGNREADVSRAALRSKSKQQGSIH